MASTACYVCLDKTNTKEIKPNISHLHIFECICFVHNNGKDNLENFDLKDDEGLFLVYSNSSKRFRFFNKRIGSI